MNFSGEIKREIVKDLPPKRCCMLSLLKGFLHTSGNISLDKGERSGFSFTSENERAAKYMLGIVEKLFAVPMTVAGAVRDPKHGRDKLTFLYRGECASEFAAEIASPHKCGDCNAYYVRGAYVGSGSCTLPTDGKKTGYHLEFLLKSKEDAEEMCDILSSLQLVGSILMRGEKFVVYFKSREAIADLLSVIGAEGALGTLESVSAEREESNQENRVLNCLSGNADRAATASAKQFVAFTRLKGKRLLPALDKTLADTLEARLEYPTLSLAELAEKLCVTKSCLNHRIRKLMKLYTETL